MLENGKDARACSLSDRECIPCKGGVPPLKGQAIEPLASQIDQAWQVVEEHHLTRTFRFKDFAEALAFVNIVAQVAEQQNHHPEIYLAWGKVRVEIHTHKIDGLAESDFVLAAKVDKIQSPPPA